MADPDSKLSVTVGTRFLLSWSADRKGWVKNVFDLVDGTTKTIPGPKPSSKFGPPKEVEIKLHITKDGEKYGFRVAMPDPSVRNSPDWKKYIFTSAFVAREEGVFLFTVELPNGKTLTKEVTITPGTDWTDKRDYMIDLLNRWMPSSVLQPRPPKFAAPEELKRGHPTADAQSDILSLAGWNKDTVKKAQDTKAASGLVTTSCGDVLSAMLRLWGCDFDGDGKMTTRAFGIRDDGAESYKDDKGVLRWRTRKGYPPVGAVTYGYYQSATDAYAVDPPILPSPGDLLVLRDGPTPAATGVGHVGIIVSVSDEVWCTGDGGGGSLDAGEQSAGVGYRLITYTKPTETHKKGIPVLKSVTDGKEKMVDGWVILDKIPNPLFDDEGRWKEMPSWWSDDEDATATPADQPAEQQPVGA